MSKIKVREKTEHVTFRLSKKQKQLLDTWVINPSRMSKFIRTCLLLEEPFLISGFVYLSNENKHILILEGSQTTFNFIASDNNYYNIIGDLIGDSEFVLCEEDKYFNQGIRLKKLIGHYSNLDAKIANEILEQLNNLLDYEPYERAASSDERILKIKTEITKTKKR